MDKTAFVIRGDIVWSRSKKELASAENGFLVCEEGRCAGVFSRLPEKYRGLPVDDRTGFLVVPGMTDLHVHAPQYAFRGLGMDLGLLEWLEKYAFPEESKYAEEAYAAEAYRIFTEDLKASETTRAVIFGTLHVRATESLMDLLEETGLVTFAGKVSMDRNSSDILQEESPGQALSAVEEWLSRIKGRYQYTRPILTPRFVPSCSDELMQGLGRLQESTGLPVQSHLSESVSEVEWVAKLCPDTGGYADAYDRFGLLGTGGPSVMAHCVWLREDETDLLKRRGTFIAHCPQSNTNLASGAAPVRYYLEQGVHTGLGTDVAGGSDLSLFRAMSDAVGVSKLRWKLCDESLEPLTSQEAFYLATAGGGAFFGKTGSFEKGYAADAVVLDDSVLRTPRNLSPEDRVCRLIGVGGAGMKVVGKYVDGRRVYG